MGNPKHLMVFGLIAATLAYGGYNLGYQNAASKVDYSPTPAQIKPTKIGPDSIVKSQQAIAVGEITKKSESTITVKGDDGLESEFKLAQEMEVHLISTSSATPPQPQKDQAAIQLNKKAIINLDLQGSDYLVSSISYLP